MTEAGPGRARAWLARTRLADRVLCRRAEHIATAADLVAEFRGCRHLVDVGAGTGHIAQALAARLPEPRFTLVDPAWTPSGRAADRLDRTAGGRWRTLAATAQSLPLEAQSADAVLVAFALHHMSFPDQVGALAEAFRVLAPGGRLVLLEDTPATRTERRRTRLADRLLNAEVRSGPHNYRPPGDWAALIERRGFVDVRSRPIGAIPPCVTLASVPHSAICARRP